jgi:acyl carrier protein
VESVEPFKFSNLSANEKSSTHVEPQILHDDTSPEIRKILVEVIAEKTGYPPELIKVDMSLDTDLGIDSIKRVEIFSQLADKIPEASTIDPQVMNKLSTLQNIVDFLEANKSFDKTLMSKKKSSSPHKTTMRLND